MRKIRCGKRPLWLTGVGAATVSTVLALLVGAAPAAAARVHAPVGPVQRIGASTLINPIWAGYAAGGAAGTFTNVGASWSQPAVSCAAGETSYSSFWVGLDGYNSRTVEQIGTDSDCINGTPTYYAWYELYPKRTVLIGSIASSDSITASVSYASGRFTLALSDPASSLAFSTTVRVASAARSSAEVIAEAPSSNHGPRGALGLADFGTINFGGAAVNGGTLASAAPDELIMEKSGIVEATPADSLSGGAFAVTWEHA